MQHSFEARPVPAPPGTCGASLPAPATEYLRRLRTLPLYAWAGAARAVEVTRGHGHGDDDARTNAAAHAALRDTVESIPGLAIHVRRCVDNLGEIAGTCVDAADTARMKRAALCSALAVATREELGESLFRRLYAPFEPLIPAEELYERELSTA